VQGKAGSHSQLGILEIALSEASPKVFEATL
jgi:hypothetical protein